MTPDLDNMLLAHSRWKMKLRAAIQGHEQIDAQTAGRDDQCELGKWLYGEGKEYARLDEYNDLRTKHARFHASIPQLIEQARSASPEKALELMDPISDFGHASSECISAIASLKRAIVKS